MHDDHGDEPSATQMSWRLKWYQDEPYSSSAVTDDADSTITRPMRFSTATSASSTTNVGERRPTGCRRAGGRVGGPTSAVDRRSAPGRGRSHGRAPGGPDAMVSLMAAPGSSERARRRAAKSSPRSP